MGGKILSAEATAAQDAAITLDDIAAHSAAQIRSENFPVALRLIPRAPRGQLARVYTFARFVDDVGDLAPGDRLALLDMVDEDVRTLWRGGAARLAPVAGLAPVLAASRLPKELFLDLVEANRMDQTVTGYEHFDDLLGYCRFSAAPVGRIVLHIAAAVTLQNVADSDAICAALQVLEHCQDVGEDAGMGRVYLPAADLRDAGVAAADLRAPLTSPALAAVIAVQVGRADFLLGAGRGLTGRLSGWARLAIAGYIAGGLATAHALRTANYRVLERPARPHKVYTAALAARLAVRP